MATSDDVKSRTSIVVSAKVSDMFAAHLKIRGDTRDKVIGEEYIGYVPSFFPGNSEDYLELEIDVDTGIILNWKVPSYSTLRRTFGVR
jgi:hypothetical protein